LNNRLSASSFLLRSSYQVMRPLRYSINVTLDGCVDHRAGSTDEELHRFWAEKLAQADALLFGRVTYEMMQAAWRWPANGLRPEWMAEWTEPFARTIDAAKKYVVSNTLEQVDWNAELVRGDLAKSVEELKRAAAAGKGLFVGGVTSPAHGRPGQPVIFRGISAVSAFAGDSNAGRPAKYQSPYLAQTSRR